MVILILTVLFAIGSLLVYRHFTWRALAWPQGHSQPPSFQGHRGFWKEGAQENTLAAFAAAKQRGLQMVEMDVRLSRDNVVVVFHDEDLYRFTGQARKVSDCTAEELKAWAQAPTLEEVLQSPNVPELLNIELKTTTVFDTRLEKAVVALVTKMQVQKRILFSSFNPLTVWRLSKYLPEVPRALLASSAHEPGNRFYLRHLLLAPYVRLHALHLDYRFVNGNRIRKWKERGVPVALWTVNDSQEAEVFLRAGALSIISDDLGKKDSF